MSYVYSAHDDWPADAVAVVGQGLDDANAAAAPLQEVRPLAVIARDGSSRVVGGALGRTWGAMCELQQLWVEVALRHRGLGARLLRRFEAAATARGVERVYLETWSFQAPGFYGALGYRMVHRLDGFPHGLVKYWMEHALTPPG